MRRGVLTAIAVLLLLGYYVIPYTLLRGARGLELLLYWAVLTILVGIISILNLRSSER